MTLCASASYLRHGLFLIGVLLLIIGTTHTSPVTAATSSEIMMDEGRAQLKKRNYQDALKAFESAERLDPSNPRPFFFSGVALNRLGRSGEALLRFDRAQFLSAVFSQDSPHPDFDFERGWALLRENRYREAVRALQQYDQDRPGRGQTAEFLGRAYLGLEQFDLAKQQFDEALRRDPKLEPTIRLALSLLEGAQGKTQEANQQLVSLLQTTPRSPVSRLLRDRLARLNQPGGDKPWQIQSTISGGYNSNVLALGDGIALPTDITSKDSGFFYASLGGNYTWDFNPTSVTVGYGFQSNTYASISSANLIDHLFSINIRHPLTPYVKASLLIADNFTQIGGDNFRNQIRVTPSLAYTINQWVTMAMEYTFAYNNYLFPVSPLFTALRDRDGTFHSISPIVYIQIPQLRTLISIRYLFQNNDTEGTDFDFNSHGFRINVQRPLFWRMMGNVQYSRTASDYNNLNSLASLPLGFAFERKDDVDFLSMTFTRPLQDLTSLAYPGMQGFLQFDYIHNESNIAFFNFSQHVVRGGVLIEF